MDLLGAVPTTGAKLLVRDSTIQALQAAPHHANVLLTHFGTYLPRRVSLIAQRFRTLTSSQRSTVLVHASQPMLGTRRLSNATSYEYPSDSTHHSQFRQISL